MVRRAISALAFAQFDPPRKLCKGRNMFREGGDTYV